MHISAHCLDIGAANNATVVMQAKCTPVTLAGCALLTSMLADWRCVCLNCGGHSLRCMCTVTVAVHPGIENLDHAGSVNKLRWNALSSSCCVSHKLTAVDMLAGHNAGVPGDPRPPRRTSS
jgi:hypothetical protein